MNNIKEQLARGVMALREERDQLIKEAALMRVRLDELEKRARVEDILVMAQGTNAPRGLRAANIEDFLTKRAKLESSSYDHIEKVAMIVEYSDSSDGIELSDVPNESGGDMTDWLKSIA